MTSPRRRRRDGITIDPARLAYFMEQRALSQARLSARCGIPDRVLRYYLDGERRPRPANFRRLYIALGCGPEDLVQGRARKADVIDKVAHRLHMASQGYLTAHEALSTLEDHVRSRTWSDSEIDEAMACIAVLRDSLRP